MRYARQYIRSAELICKEYEGTQPLALFLKQYFQQNKKFGSKDRKYISHLCYTYYRLGKAAAELSFEERLKLALFLCEDQPGDWQELFEQPWLENWPAALDERIRFAESVHKVFNRTTMFPWADQLSAGIDAGAFIVSHFRQPALFLRVRPGFEQKVPEKLQAAAISFTGIGVSCIALANGTKIDAVLDLDREVVVQDINSQRTGELLRSMDATRSLRVWDACAASGGKSILAKDLLGNIDLTVSDLRESILNNLRKRFERAGLQACKLLVTDLSKPGTQRPTGMFDLVICDVPCSGSGTWARTPEQLHFFEPSRIAEYAGLQQAIVQNVSPQVSPGAYLLYLTCSVFAAENERQVEKLQAQGFELLEQRWFTGYNERADSLFGALLRKR
jgi:16S rRNA (cytosine967-C5)-methyltransferase